MEIIVAIGFLRHICTQSVDLPSGLDLVPETRFIRFPQDPTGRWFSCLRRETKLFQASAQWFYPGSIPGQGKIMNIF